MNKYIESYKKVGELAAVAQDLNVSISTEYKHTENAFSVVIADGEGVVICHKLGSIEDSEKLMDEVLSLTIKYYKVIINDSF